jgi:hypothetical protein
MGMTALSALRRFAMKRNALYLGQSARRSVFSKKASFVLPAKWGNRPACAHGFFRRQVFPRRARRSTSPQGRRRCRWYCGEKPRAARD